MYGATPKGADDEEGQAMLETAHSGSAVHPVSPNAISNHKQHHSATDSFSSSEKKGFFSPLHYESIDFDPVENQVFQKKALQRLHSDDSIANTDWYRILITPSFFLLSHEKRCGCHFFLGSTSRIKYVLSSAG